MKEDPLSFLIWFIQNYYCNACYSLIWIFIVKISLWRFNMRKIGYIHIHVLQISNMSFILLFILLWVAEGPESSDKSLSRERVSLSAGGFTCTLKVKHNLFLTYHKSNRHFVIETGVYLCLYVYCGLLAYIQHPNGLSLMSAVFDDGDEKTLRRSSLCLKGARHFAESEVRIVLCCSFIPSSSLS